MAFVHFGSSILIVPAGAFAWLILGPFRQRLGRTAALVAIAVAGAAACQLVYGLLNLMIWNGDFFFVGRQLEAGTTTLQHMREWQPLAELAVDAPWLSIHLGVWLATVFALIFCAVQRRLDRPLLLVGGALVATYGLLGFTDYVRLSEFLARSGLYASFFLFVTYLVLGLLVPRWLSWPGAFVAAAFFLASLLVRLDHGGHVPGLDAPAWLIGVLFAASLVVARLAAGVPLLAPAALCLGAGATLFLYWPFQNSEQIYRAHAIVRDVAGDDFPYFAYDEADPLYLPAIISVVGSFTERAWAARNPRFPAAGGTPMDGETVFVLSSTMTAPTPMQDAFSATTDGAELISFNRVETPQGELAIGGFRVRDPISLPVPSTRRSSGGEVASAAALPSHTGTIEGTARAAHEGRDAGGVLTYGPYARLLAGDYIATIAYSAAGTHTWDVIAADATQTLGSGTFPETGGGASTVNIPFSVKERIDDLEVRTLYSGTGTLTVRSVEIAPR